MNNVDLIIKYLSGEMNQDEAGHFEKEVASNPELEEEFKNISAAYQLIRDQLRKRDEQALRAKLIEVMERPSLKVRKRSWRSGWYLLLPLAGSLALLLSIYLMRLGSDRILSRFCEPERDPVVLAYSQGTRGDSESGIMLYQTGHYQESMNDMSQVLDLEPENQVALLFYLLASLELDLQEMALERVLSVPNNNIHQLEQSLTWYATMGLIKSGLVTEAAAQIQPLTESEGPYRQYARRLQRRFLK